MKVDAPLEEVPVGRVESEVIVNVLSCYFTLYPYWLDSGHCKDSRQTVVDIIP